MTASIGRRIGVATLALGVATLGGGCGDADGGVPEHLGKIAAEIQGCNAKLSARTPPRAAALWVDATRVDAVTCGPPDVSDGRLLVVAQYPSSAAASAAARDYARGRLLCVVDRRVLESWMYPYAASDESKADRLAQGWARDFCVRAKGRSTGRWSAWRFSR